jgi:2-C-methyl-D-erythritol 2,4-cyclodiphosphate synthase
MIRTGLGWDLHRLVSGRRFLLGGVEIPFEKGELGHSDGDVLAHAVTDALLGAATLGDIGELYPPQDPAWKDADSLVLLRSAYGKVLAAGWRLVNLDCVVICEKPRILPHREAIRISLACALGVDTGDIFVKGKTAEGLGPVGEGLGVEARVTVLLERPDELYGTVTSPAWDRSVEA